MKTFIAILLALSLVLVACSQGANNGTNGTGESKAADKVDKGAGSSGEAEFLKLLGGKVNLEYKVAYDLKTVADKQTVAMQYTQYMKTEKKIRMDSTYQGMESQTYMVSDTYTMCTKQSGAWTCFKLDTPKEQAADTKAYETKIEDNPSDYSTISDGTMQVAGVTATCFKITGVADKLTSRYCFKDGVPLYIYMEYDGGSSEMKATSYSTRVSDSEFVPPAKAQDMNALIGGAGAGADACAYCSYLTGTDKDDCLANCGK